MTLYLFWELQEPHIFVLLFFSQFKWHWHTNCPDKNCDNVFSANFLTYNYSSCNVMACKICIDEEDWIVMNFFCHSIWFENEMSLAQWTQLYFDGLVQDCSNSIANTLELLQTCIKLFIWCLWLISPDESLWIITVVSYRIFSECIYRICQYRILSLKRAILVKK